MTANHMPRHDGWTPLRQRIFLESLSLSGMVRHAARAAEMSHEATYNLRNRQEGSAFRLGWDAALLLARAPVADRLMERALEGQEDVIVHDDDGRTRTRHRHDNRLALSLLARLDRFAEEGHVAHADARLVAGAWEAFLVLVESATTADADADALAQFLDARRPVVDADNNASGPCQFREGEVAPDEREDSFLDSYIVWWNKAAGEYRTNFPPPSGFDGFISGDFATGYGLNSDYERGLSPIEAARETAINALEAAEKHAKAEAWRRAWFEIEEGVEG